MLRLSMVLGGVALAACFSAVGPAQAETIIQQCGEQYQAAKSAGTLNGMTWNQYRAECSMRLKATPASTGAAPEPTPAPPPAAENPLKPTTTAAAPAPAPAAPPAASMPMTKSGKPLSAGRTAMLTRERQCGSEWRTQKATLVAQTPGLTWPKYWSQCNTRLKAAGQ